MSATRRQIREWVVQMLTAADLNPPDDPAFAMVNFFEALPSLEEENGETGEATGKPREMAEQYFMGVMTEMKSVDETLVGLLEHWDLYRLGTIERAVLRLGVWEMSHTTVPKAVVINECIDLVNWFSSPRSRTLINGVLDRYGKSL